MFGLGAAETPEVHRTGLVDQEVGGDGVAPVDRCVLAADRRRCGVPSVSASTVAAGIAGVEAGDGAAALTVMGSAPAPASMVYSAAAMFEPPVAVSSPVAWTATPAAAVSVGADWGTGSRRSWSGRRVPAVDQDRAQNAPVAEGVLAPHVEDVLPGGHGDSSRDVHGDGAECGRSCAVPVPATESRKYSAAWMSARPCAVSSTVAVSVPRGEGNVAGRPDPVVSIAHRCR